MDYVELHAHDYYSPLDGLSSPEEYMIRAKEVGIDKLAQTNHGTMAGTRHFQRAAEAAGITPIIGVEAYISATDRFDKRATNKRTDGTNKYNHIILLAKNDEGVRELNRMSEIAWNEGYYSKPRIDWEVLDKHGQNIVVLSGCMSGLIARPILDGNLSEAHYWTRKFKERFADDFYIEVQEGNHAVLNHGLLNFADHYGIKPVITSDCHYADPADRAFEEAFLILGTKPTMRKEPDMTYAAKLDLLDRFDYLYPDRTMRFRDIELYLERANLRHAEMMKKGFDRTDIFENTVEVGDKIGEYSYKKNEYTLPAPERDIRGVFMQIVNQGMRKRGLANKPEYVKRLEEEIKVIQDKDIEIYFIILADALRFCRKENIAYGAGRGSAAGSLVCYAMEITEVDPIEHKLLFWRFLDPERDDMPDIDVDIQDTRRSEVKRYLADKYGHDKVASVSNYGMYQGKSSIKAAARILNIKIKEVNAVVKKLSNFVDDDAAEKNMYEYENSKDELLVEFRNKYPEVAQIAKKISGRLANYSIHAGGVVITERPLTDWTGVESRAVEGETFRQSVIALNGDGAAELGLVKYDFLGLKNLSVVADSVQFVKENHGILIDFKKIKEDDPKVFKMIADGQTLGVFQATADASTDVIKKMGIDNFNDLVASNALVRPGAWKAFGADYIARKKGTQKVAYPTKESEHFLDETFGFYLYQEQTMQICTLVAGMTQSEANKIRKLTAKKKSKTELQPYKEKFFEGARKNVTEKVAEKLWADIELTAEYSFNKCLAEDTKIDIRYFMDGFGDVEETVTLDVLNDYLYNQDDMGEVYVKGPEWVKASRVGPDAWHRIINLHDNGEKPVVRISTSSENYIDATLNHKHRLSKQWKPAGRIKQNDQIWTDEGKKTVAHTRFAGIVQTYDIELADEPHAFYANGFLTHNSHAVAYSKLSYVTAWFKYHYPAEFMTALLNNENPAAEGNKISEYLVECNRMGIKVNRPDINMSGKGYSTTNNQIYMGLSNVKGIADRSAELIMAQRPYTSYADLLEKVATPKNGVTNAHLKSLDAIGAYNFKDKKVDDKMVAENFYEFLGIPTFDTAMLSDEMQSRITRVMDYDEDDVQIMTVIVKKLESKNGWNRVSFIDSTGSGSCFADDDHGLQKGHKYIMLVAKNSLMDYIDLGADFNPNHFLLKYLRGDMSEGNWVVSAKVRITKNKKQLGTLVFTHRDILRTCLIFDRAIPNARMYCKKGRRVELQVNATKDGTLFLEGAAEYVPE